MTCRNSPRALDRVKAETGIDKFEVIGFDMCLMAQLEVMESIAPYARYGIGSEENEPGAGWFYLFLDEMVKDPSMDGAQVGRHVVDYFMYFLREVVGDQDVYGLAALDLSQGPAMVEAVNQFAAAVSANPAAALSPIADARNNVRAYGGFNDEQIRDIFSSVDLYQLAELTKDISSDPTLQAAAQGVMDAVQSYVVYQDHVEALAGTNGLAIYFPRSVKNYKVGAFNERYPNELPDSMANWVTFLDVFHGTATTTVTEPPKVNIVKVYPDVISIYEPAVLTLEVTGRDILRVNYAVTYDISENERVVLDYDYLVSRTTTTTGANIIDWSDGVTQYTWNWGAEVPVLTDGAVRTYGLLLPNVDSPDVYQVNGMYQSGSGGDPIQAQLLFNRNTRTSTALWGLNETASGNLQPFELQVTPGDTFQPLWLTLDANNELAGTSLGDPLVFEDVASIYFELIPAPTGAYSISFVAENVAGDNNLSEVNIQVNNDGLDENYRGYTDLTYGVNFRYPANWIRPRFTPDGTRLFTADLSTNTVLSLYPYTDVTSAEETDAAIRASWNELQDLVINQQRAVDINGLSAFVTDYTYTYNDEARTGAVIAIYVPQSECRLCVRPGRARRQSCARAAGVTGVGREYQLPGAAGKRAARVRGRWSRRQVGRYPSLCRPTGRRKSAITGRSTARWVTRRCLSRWRTAPVSGQTNTELADYWRGPVAERVYKICKCWRRSRSTSAG